MARRKNRCHNAHSESSPIRWMEKESYCLHKQSQPSWIKISPPVLQDASYFPTSPFTMGINLPTVTLQYYKGQGKAKHAELQVRDHGAQKIGGSLSAGWATCCLAIGTTYTFPAAGKEQIYFDGLLLETGVHALAKIMTWWLKVGVFAEVTKPTQNMM